MIPKTYPMTNPTLGQRVLYRPWSAGVCRPELVRVKKLETTTKGLVSLVQVELDDDRLIWVSVNNLFEI